MTATTAVPTTIKETLAKAGDLLAEHGWSTGSLIDDRGCMCALGAIGVAVVGAEGVHTKGYNLFDEEGSLAGEAAQAVAEAIQSRHESCDRYDYTDVYSFNDCEARQVEDVIGLFAQAVESLS